MELAMLDFALIIQLFVLLNPLSSFPFLMAAHRKKMNVKNIAIFSVLTAFVIALLITFVGPFLFEFFGITLSSFRVAGGIVLLLLGLDTIRPKEKEIVNVGGVHSLISIIATPMLTGPATISFITIKAVELSQLAVAANLIPAFILVGVVFISFAYAVPKVNANLINISSRILGLFLTAVSIEMIFTGVKGLLGI
ncbi:MAG TPA: MarC family protein [Candidatus Nanoarchaeia archaeon]|nr:MarC family protein [Candidatus Nanoarchaeia archaeon]